VVGNLPYNLTSPILRRLCEWSGWSEAWVMVQKEVGDRLIAKSGSPDFGALTVGMNLTCTMERVFDLSPASFDPKPKVDSSIIHLKRRAQNLTPHLAFTQRVVQAAFQQRRKTILNSLAHGLVLTKEEILAVLKISHIEEGIRPERLTTEQFVLLADHLLPYFSADTERN
jgi:16S rRNA (adenine1518-N6/adenine1519-N6)-dimethyltransferase